MKRFTLGTINIIVFDTEEEARIYYRDTYWGELSGTIYINSEGCVDSCFGISCVQDCPIGPYCSVAKHINTFKKLKEN